MTLSNSRRTIATSLTAFVAALFLFVATSPVSAEDSHHEELTREQIALQLIAKGALLVDVRRAEEFAAGHLDGAIHIPHDETEARLAEYGADKSREIVVYCRSGRRSGIATEILRANGFTNVHNGGGYEPILAAKG